MKHCLDNKPVSGKLTWFIPPGKTIAEYTICEFCFNNYLINTPESGYYVKYSQFNICNCDYANFSDNNKIYVDDLVITIHDATNAIFPKAYNLPVNDKYQLVIPVNTDF